MGNGAQCKAFPDPAVGTPHSAVAKSPSADAARQNTSTNSDSGVSVSAKENPCRSKGFDADRHQLAVTGKVEAAGIEPASRNSSTQASTCVVELFNLATLRPCRPGRLAASSEQVLAASVPSSDSRRFGFSDGLLNHSDYGPQSGLPLIRQPKRNCRWQLKL